MKTKVVDNRPGEELKNIEVLLNSEGKPSKIGRKNFPEIEILPKKVHAFGTTMNAFLCTYYDGISCIMYGHANNGTTSNPSTVVIDRRSEVQELKPIEFLYDRYGNRAERKPEMFEEIEIYHRKASMKCECYDLFICFDGKYTTTFYGNANDGIVNSE